MESAIAELFLAHSTRKLQQMREHASTCLDKLTDEQIWSRGGDHENSIGNLVLHLCGNARQWIVAGVGGEKDIRDRDREFSTKGGLSRDELKAHLNVTVDQAITVLQDVTPARLTEVIDPQTGPVSVLEAIYQVVGHFQQHVGQIVFVTKMHGGRDLGLTKLPARATAKL